MAAYTQVYANNVSSTLASPITSTSQTSISLTSAANLPTIPTGDIFALTLNDAATQTVFEVLYVTAISGSTLTVQRGQEGTTATTWLAGDYAYGATTRGTLGNFAQTSNLATFPYGLNTSALTVTGGINSANITSSGQVSAAQVLSSGPVIGTLITGTSVESNGSYVPPVFLSNGGVLGSNTHIVFGGVSLNFSSSSTASATVTLSGAAAFLNSSSFVVLASLNATTPYIVNLSTSATSGMQFTITATYTSAITTTIGVGYFCVGQ